MSVARGSGSARIIPITSPTDRRLIVLVELRPIQRHHELAALRYHELHPVGEPEPDGDSRVAEESVDLLDGMLRIAAHRIGQSASDGMDTQRRGVQHSDDALGKGQDALRVDILLEKLFDKFVHALRRHLHRSACGLGGALRGHGPWTGLSIAKFQSAAKFEGIPQGPAGLRLWG